MNRQELRATFKDMLNRSDCTDAKADTFLDWGLRRVERILRTPLQRYILNYNIPANYPSYIIVPGGYLGMDWIKVNGHRVDRVAPTMQGDLDDIMSGDYPTYFWVENEQIHFRRKLQEGDTVRINYYGEQSLGTDATVSRASLVIPDLVVYSALVFAADHFVDTRKQEFVSTMTGLITEVQAMADMDNLIQGVVLNTQFPEGYF